MTVRLFGVRHHGPGSARNLQHALTEFQPTTILIEGPADAQDAIEVLRRQELTPPVALLVTPTDQPLEGVYYPEAEFSPEWQALRFAVAGNIPAQFIDLPVAHSIALDRHHRAKLAETPLDAETTPTDPSPTPPTLMEDPIALLSEAAGFEDRELWWEIHIEQRRDPTGVFAGLQELMTELRQELQPEGPTDARETLREAHMRQAIRKADGKGERVAVVCGAWHLPALVDLGGAVKDRDLLKGLDKVKTSATWIPWSYSRLAARNGYGAGVESPAWYEHLWRWPDRPALGWILKAARLLRKKDLDASSASVIEAVRLAHTLAALRLLPKPGLTECKEAIRAVLCQGDDTPMSLIRDRLEIGDRLGVVPADACDLPIMRDLLAQQKALRLKPSTEIKSIELDLRKELDRQKSRLLRRLTLLGIAWGREEHVTGLGTFKEKWRIVWEPEFAVRLVEASMFGPTIAEAAVGTTLQRATAESDLAALTELLDAVVLAELDPAIEAVLAVVQERSAASTDVSHWLGALPTLARSLRYEGVRKTPTAALQVVFDGLFERALIGLPAAVAGIDIAAAHSLLPAMTEAQHCLDLLQDATKRSAWLPVLEKLIDDDAVHPLVRGGCCRLLLLADRLPPAHLDRSTRLAMSKAVAPAASAYWLQGLVEGPGLSLLHYDALWQILDDWLVSLAPDAFLELVPLLRRAFSSIPRAERRLISDKVRDLGQPTAAVTTSAPISTLDPVIVAQLTPIFATLLGVTHD